MAIGEEIAQFYLDGVEITSSNLGSKSYLLAHILREIDGGLRDVFESKSKKDQFQKEITNEELERLFKEFREDYKNYDYLKDTTFEDFKEAKGHISSIMVSFGFSFDNPLSKQYIKIARWLNKYAHRSGAYNAPRDPKDILNIWNEFEEVLAKLIGNYYAIADRVDSILKLDEPTKEVLKTLPNLLNVESRFIYFFNGLKSPKWLPHLYSEGYFLGSLNPEPIEVTDNPGYYSIPYWGVLQYLEQVADVNFNIPNDQISKILGSVIKNILTFRKEDGSRIENYRTDYTLYKLICKLPEENLSKEHFLFIKESLESKWHGLIGHDFGNLLDRLLKDEKKTFLFGGIEILLAHRYFEDKAFEKVHSIFQPYELKRILSEYKEKLIDSCGFKLLETAVNKAEELIALDRSSFNNISLPAIENHEQTSFPEKFDCQIAYLIRDCLEVLPIESVIESIKKLLKLDHPIFQRLAVHTIRIRYTELNSLFWKWDKNPLNHTLVKHEIFELLKEHSKYFKEEQITKVLEWIDKKEYYIPEEFEGKDEIIDKSIAYRKKEWLDSLLGNTDIRIQNNIDELNKINNAKVDHPGFDSFHSGFSGTISPLNNEDILRLNIEELIEYFNDFSKKNHDFMGPSIDGLSDAIVFAIRKNPKTYNFNCDLILKSDSYFKYTWIRGLNESWRDEKLEFECGDIFTAVFKIINNQEFWDSHNSNDIHCRWFISSLISFIKDGLRDDNHAFDKKLLPLLKDIIILIYEKDKHEIFDHSDLSMTVLNNSKGKILIALMQYSLRLARVEAKENERWDLKVKSIISDLINSEEENVLLYYVLGQFLPNIHFLDEDWLLKNFNLIFPLKNKKYLSAALGGYLFHHRRPNKKYFDLFLQNGQYLEAIQNDFEFFQRDARNSLIEQICIAYLYEFDGFNLEHELMTTLLYSKNENNYSSLIHFFWSPKYPLESKVLNKINPLWEKIFINSINLKNHEIDKYILSGCCKWINSISEIDDNVMPWITKSIPYISQRDRHSIIESLSKHINNSPEKVGLILLELFKSEVSYDILQGKIAEMLVILYEKGIVEVANKICLLHAEKGFHQFREIYIKYNS